MPLGVRIKKLRLKRGESLQDVADAVGCSKAHVWELEQGRAKNPSMALLKAIADHFDLTVAALAGEDLFDTEADRQLARLFRQAQELSDRDLNTIEDMIKAMRRRMQDEKRK
ncbi:MAG: helix-turn-helix transcriptional regulator [Parvularculaceae bacterium]